MHANDFNHNIVFIIKICELKVCGFIEYIMTKKSVNEFSSNSSGDLVIFIILLFYSNNNIYLHVHGY